MYYISKFTKEIIRMWQTVPDPLLSASNKSNETLDKNLMNYVMV